jgi:hypothetical protein
MQPWVILQVRGEKNLEDQSPIISYYKENTGVKSGGLFHPMPDVLGGVKMEFQSR